MKLLSRINFSILFAVLLCCLLMQVVAADTRSASGAKMTEVSALAKVASGYAARTPSDSAVAARLDAFASSTTCSEKQVYDAIIAYARSMMAEGRQVEVFDLLSTLSAMVDFDKENRAETDFIIDMYVLLGSAADETGMSNVSMEYYTRGLSLAEDTGDQHAVPRFLNNIGVSYFRLGDMDKAEDYFMRALDLNKTFGFNYDLFLNYNNLAEVDLQRNQLDNALDDALKAMQYLHGADDEDMAVGDMEGYIQSVIATIYIGKKEYHIARSYVENAISQLRLDGMSTDLFESYMINSELFLHENQPDSAFKWVNSALLLVDGQSLNLRSNALERLSQIEDRQGKTAASLDHLREAYALRDSLANIEKVKRMEQCQKIYEVDRKNRQERQSASSLTGFSLFLFIMLCFVLLLLLWQWIERRKAANGAEMMRLSVEQMAGEREHEREEARHESHEMKARLDLAHRQLTNFTIQKLRNGQQTEEIVTDMRRLLNESGSRVKDIKEELSKMLSKIVIHKSSDDWTEFNYYFERVNTAFYRNLKAAHPDITEKQKRLCALLYLGLNTKEIAQIMFREVRSIESSRSRLRKKLGLGEDDNLNDYFQKFAEENEE